MLRKTLGVLAVVVLASGGKAYSGGLTAPPRPTTPCTACAGSGYGHAPGAHGNNKIGGYVDENILYPELAPWVFQRSHCRRLLCGGTTCGGQHRHAEKQIPYFPPLPYSHKAANYAPPAGAPQAGAFPAP